MITKITTHEAQALARMITQYKGMSNFEDIFKVLVGQVQEVEDALYDEIDLLSVDTAEGVWLDVLGKVVGQRRNNTTDIVYRALIKAKIGVNVSEGLYADLVNIFKILTLSTEVTLSELFPAEVAVYGNEEIDPSIESLIYGFMQDAAGAGILVSEVGVYDDDSFIFSDDPIIPPVGDGFSDDAETEGGGFARDY